MARLFALFFFYFKGYDGNVHFYASVQKKEGARMRPFTAADILLPGPQADLSAWAVLACDQFTSTPAYWQQVQAARKGKPSALDIILPECYLEKPDTPARGGVYICRDPSDKACARGRGRELRASRGFDGAGKRRPGR